jgi:hypothetical protein
MTLITIGDRFTNTISSDYYTRTFIYTVIGKSGNGWYTLKYNTIEDIYDTPPVNIKVENITYQISARYDSLLDTLKIPNSSIGGVSNQGGWSTLCWE